MAIPTTQMQMNERRGLAQGGGVGSPPAAQARQDLREGGAAYQGREDNVANVAAQMMDKDSPLMQRAAQKGQLQANQRGLLNSSMAAGASMGSALDQIVPMAGQTAGQEFQKNRAGQDYQIDTSGAMRDEGINNRAARRDYGFQRGLNQQTAGLARGQTKLEYAERGNLSRKEAAQTRVQTTLEAGLGRQSDRLQSSLARGEAAQANRFDRANMQLDGQIRERLAAQGFDAERELTQMENQFEARQNNLNRALEKSQAFQNMSADARRGAETMVSNVFNDYSGDIASIMSNPNLTASERTKQIEAAQQNVNMRMELIESMNGTEFDWPGASGSSSSRTAAASTISKPAASRSRSSGRARKGKK